MAWYWFISEVRNETVTRDKVTKVLPFRLPFCSLRFRLPSPSCSNASSSSSFGVSSPLLLQEQWGFSPFFGYYFTVSHTTATASFAFVFFFFSPRTSPYTLLVPGVLNTHQKVHVQCLLSLLRTFG